MLMSVEQRYPNFSGLSAAFSSSLSAILVSDIEKAYSEKSPVIGDIDRIYGNGSSSVWVKTQVLGLDFVSSTKESADINAMDEFAQLFSRQYSHIKLTEFLLFIARFKLGRYGKFYGYFDMLTIGEAFRKYLKERSDELDILIRRQNNRAIDERKPYVPVQHEPPEYIKSLMKNKKSR